MTIPLIVLAVFAVAVGFVVGPGLHYTHFLQHTPGLPPLEHEHPNWALMIVTTIIGLGGIALAAVMYAVPSELPAKLARGAGFLYQLSLNKFYIDELYEAFIVQPLQGLAVFLRQIDLNLVDALVDLVGNVPRLLGSLFRPVQNGLVQFYALAMILGLTVFLLALVRSL